MVMDKEMTAFRKLLNRVPNAKAIREHNKLKYLPISYTQQQLDRIFDCMWSWEITDTKLIANEILVHGVLKVKHPVTGEWLTRSGAGAAQIRLKSGSAPTDIHNKIMNACVADFPNAEAMALSSAAKKLGKIFGRDIGRKADQVEHYTVDELSKESTAFFALVEKPGVTAIELTDAYRALSPDISSDQFIIDIYKTALETLKIPALNG